MNVLHPLFVHLHIAFLLMAFLSMAYWLVKGLGQSIFDDKLYQFARVCTRLGVVFIVFSMGCTAASRGLEHRGLWRYG